MKQIKTLHFLDIVIALVMVTSATSLALLAVGRFQSVWALLIAGLFTTAIFVVLTRSGQYKLSFKLGRSAIPVVSLLVLGAIFRYDPYTWIPGGQDQGTYVNMSSHFQDTGRAFGIDILRESLSAEYRNLYDRSNYRVRKIVENENEGGYLPGVFLKDQEKSEYVFQFYHLHPLWMAIFADAFGDNRRVYSLVFFALLSIVAFYFMALEFTGNRLLAWLAGALLALNPLHVFFSKFPVTEVVALAFSSLSFYYLLRYYKKTKESQYTPIFLVFSSLSIAGMFFTRISGFMYMPFFYLLLLVVELYASDPLQKKQLRLYLLSVFLFYLLSVLYGLNFSYPYTYGIHRFSFSRALGSNWQTLLPYAGMAAVLIYLIVVFQNRVYPLVKFKTLIANAKSSIPYMFLLFLVLGGYKVYQLGFTTSYVDAPWEGVRWQAAESGWRALLYWSPIVLVEYLSPFIGILFAYVAFSSRHTISIDRFLLLVFILFFCAYLSVLQWFIPYQYYYARYLLSEGLPYVLLFSIISISALGRRKSIAYTLVALGAVYMAAFSATQFRGKEMENFEESLDVLTQYIETDDVLLVGSRWVYSALGSELKTPLVFYYNYKVLSTDQENVELFLDYYCRSKQYVYYLGGERTEGLGLPLRRLAIKVERFEHKPYIPTRVVEQSLSHGLFRVDCKGWNRYRSTLH